MFTINQTPGSATRVPKYRVMLATAKLFLRKTMIWMMQHKVVSAIVAAVILFGIITTVIWSTAKPTSPQHSTNPVVMEYQKNLPDLKKSVQSKPKDVGIRKNYAVALYVTRDLNEAKKQYEAAISLDDKDATTYNNLGNVYRDLNQPDKAIQMYQQAIDHDPKAMNTYANLANIQLYTKNKPGDAIGTYKKALVQLPDNTQLEQLLGIAYEQAGDKASAERIYQTILSHDKNNIAAKTSLDRLTK